MLMTSAPLPPVTPRLRRGLGAGERRAAEARPGRITVYGDTRRRPERETLERFRGPLGEGVEGVLATHWHLAEAEEHEWVAWPGTLVYAEVPVAARLIAAAVAHRPQPLVSGATLTLGRAQTVPPVPDTRIEHDGFAWTFTPAVGSDVAAAVAGVLAGAPPDTVVELESGSLCVFADRADADGEALWRVAARLVVVLAALAPADVAADVPVGPPPRSPRRDWVEAGAAQLAWPVAPASVDEAVAAYTAIAPGRRTGWVVGLALLVVAAAVTVAALWVGVQTGLAVGGPITAAFGLWLLWRIARAAVGAGREVGAGERAARAQPWGLEAFVRGYAASRGLVIEDPAAVRRGFDSPVRGRAVAALHGPTGHLLLWRTPEGERWLVRVGTAIEARRADWTASALDAFR